MEIKNNILKTELVKWRGLRWLQGDNFKEISKAQFEKLKASLVKNGFAQPFNLWENGESWVLDGVHRKRAMLELEKEGYAISDELPANFIECRDERHAKEMVLVYSSVYARISEETLYEFISLNELDFGDLKSEIDLPDLDLERFNLGYFGDGGISGIDAPSLRIGDRAPFRQITFVLHDSQFEDVELAVRKAKTQACDTGVNLNSNGNALALICREFNREARG